MPKCRKCGRAMATLLKREGDAVRTYYECPACPKEAEEAEPSGPAPPEEE
jgi:hypothetical protein